MKKILIVIFLVLFLAGCSTVPYIRSDVFVDPQAVNSVYVMPIVTEVTLDVGYDISRENLTAMIKESKENIKNMLQEEFTKRGYKIAGYSQEFQSLDSENESDQLAILAIKEFLHPTGIDSDEDSGKEFFKLLFGNMGVKDANGNIKTLKELNKDDEKDEKPSPLVLRTIDMKPVIPKNIDTVMYLEVKSFIARRGLWKSLQEKSTVTVIMKMVGVTEEKIVFSYTASQKNSDILDWQSFKKIFADVINKIPVKLDVN